MGSSYMQKHKGSCVLLELVYHALAFWHLLSNLSALKPHSLMLIVALSCSRGALRENVLCEAVIGLIVFSD